ncbi:MAG: hypothetical protein AB7V43_01550 [Acidimicrobiia bacterium]
MSTIRWVTCLLGLTLLVSACGDEAAEPTVSLGPTVTTSTDIDTTLSSVPVPTTAPTDTAATSVAKPSTSSGTSPTTVPALPDTLLVGWDNGVIAEHDIRSGKIVRTITTEAYPEGRFFSDLHRAPNGAVYVASGYEDSWYSCDYIDGDISVIDGDGSIDRIAPGGPPIISADGTKLAYLTSSDCVTDPENEMWFVSNIDTLVVRTLATGAERSWTFPGAQYRADARPVLRSPVWANGGAVLVMSDDRIVTVDVNSTAVPSIASGKRAMLSSGSATELWLEAVRPDGNIVAQLWPAVGSAEGAPTRLVLLESTTGKELSEIAKSTAVEEFSVDSSGQHWATINDNQVIVDGRALDLVSPEPGDYKGDLYPMLVGW